MFSFIRLKHKAETQFSDKFSYPIQEHKHLNQNYSTQIKTNVLRNPYLFQFKF